MQINFITLESQEVKKGKILYDLGEIEYFINDHLKDESFKDVQQFGISLHTYVLNGPFSPFFKPLSTKRGYKAKGQILHITKDVDYLQISRLGEEDQQEEIKKVILGAIQDARKLQGRIKGFDFDKLHDTVLQVLTKYISMNAEVTCEKMQ